MSFIPNCRTHETYNQKYLGQQDKNFLNGFDWAVEMAVDNFFDNDMFGLLDENTRLGHVLVDDLPDDMCGEYTMEFTFDREDEKREVKTYADFVRMKLLAWIEANRDELITSMIDNMDEEEYKRIKEEVDGQSEGTD